MSREEILEMKPGRELDVLVAQKIFDNCVCGYSTDITAAWQVVEKMRTMEDSEGNHLLCCLEIYSDYDFCWEVRWSYAELSIHNDGHKTHSSGCFDEFPEAICKAALLTKLV